MSHPAGTHEEIEAAVRDIQAKRQKLRELENGSEDRVPLGGTKGVMDMDIYGTDKDNYSNYVTSIAANDEPDNDDEDYTGTNGSLSKKSINAPSNFLEDVIDKDHDPLAERRVPRIADREDEYRARHRKQMISPPRIDPFAEAH